MKKITMILFALFAILQANAQIGIVQGLNSTVVPTGWTATGFAGTLVSPCEGTHAWRKNFYVNGQTGSLTTKNYVAASNGTDVTVSFQWKGTEWSVGAGVGVSMNVEFSTDNGTTWQAIGEPIVATEITECAYFNATIPGALVPEGSDFKFRVSGTWVSGDCYFWVDEVSLTQVSVSPPSCTALITPAADAVEVSSGIITWGDANGITSGYKLNVGTTPGGSDVMNMQDVGSVLTYDLGVLSAATTYYVTVIPYNDNGDATGCTSSSFSTCGSVTIPWSEDFDALTPGTNVFPSCWSYVNTSSNWSISTTPVAHSGANSLRRTWSTNGWAFTPTMALTAGTSYTFSYYMRTNDSNVGYDIDIAAGEGQGVDAMTETLSSVTGYFGPSWTKFSYQFTPASTGNYSFGIHVVAPAAPNGINFDDLKVDLTPSCVEPTGLLVDASSLSSSTASISWNESVTVPANGYEYYVSTDFTPPTADMAGNGTVAAGSTTANLTGLDPVSTYFFWVRSVCSASDSSEWSLSVTFKTLCEPVSSLPWTENFDALAAGTNVFPSCWSYVNTTSNWSISATPVAYSGTNSLRRTWSTNGWAFTPTITLTAGTSYTFSYFMRTNDSTVGYDIDIAAGQGQGVDAMTETLSSVTGYFGPAWTKFSYEFTPSSTGDYSFGIHVVAPNAPNGINFDDLKVDVTPSCVEPTGLVVDTAGITSSTASVSWNESVTVPANGYQYYLSTENVAPTADTAGNGSVAAGSTTANLTALDPATTYYIWVKSVCSASDSSEWSLSASFTTLCIPLATLPWTEDFDSLATGTNVFPSCWSYVNTTSNWTISTTPVAHSGANSLRRTWSTDGWAFTPAMTLTAGTSYSFSYYVRTNDSNVGYDITVAAGQGQGVDAMTETLSAVTGYFGPAWTKFSYEFTPSSTGDYSFGLHVVAPVAPNGINFDDLKVDVTPTCVEPTSLVVDTAGITSSTASVSWTESITVPANGYEYYISTENVAPTADMAGNGTVAAGSTTANLTALDPATTYYFWVRSVCSASDASEWSSSVSFMTLCVPLTTLPWTENFDSLATGNNIFPSCWAYVNTTSNWSIATAPTAYSGANSLRRTWSTNGWAFTPTMSLTAGTPYRFSYYMRTNDSTVGYDITVAAGAGQGIASMTETLSSVTGYFGATWTKFTYTFVPQTTGDYSFGIHVVAPAAPNGINFDDFKVDLAPSCIEPTALIVDTAGVTATTATVSWTASVTTPANGYAYYLSTSNTAPTADTAATGTVAAGATSAALTSLTPATIYYIWVRSVCSASDLSEWTLIPATFTTACGVITPSYTQDFAVFFPNCWTRAAAGDVTTGPTGTANGIWAADGFLNAGTTGAMKVNLYSLNRIGWAVTPAMNLSAGNYQVSFNYAVTAWGATGASAMGSDDSVRLVMSQDDGVTWSEVVLFDASSNVPNSAQLFTMPIASTSSTVRFAFLATDGTVDDSQDYDFFIDNFKVESLLGTPVIDQNAFSFYPNPVKNVLNLSYSTTISSVAVFNLLGQQVVAKNINANNGQVDMSNLSAGTYIVKVSADNQVKTIKVIKE